jgi:uncharacterized protein YheU (UPF0270 family)
VARFLEVPTGRLAPDTLTALLEEYASRDGTDYGEREHTLEEKVGRLRRLLTRGDLVVLYDSETEYWDLADRERACELLEP